MPFKIMLDAGHYAKYNQSPVVSAYYESNMNWKLHLLLKDELEKLGFIVGTTRKEKDKDLSLTNRGKAAQGYDLLLSLHSNACGTESVDYPVAIVMQDGKGDELGRKLAICAEEVMGTRQSGRISKKKGTYGGEWYSVLAGAASVGTMGIILEHSFHTNEAAAKWLLNDNNLSRLAKAEAQVISEYFGVQPVKADTVTVALPILRKGSKGEAVEALQILLDGWGYELPEFGADGDFGAETDKALRLFQKDNCLTVDGIAGSETWNCLLGN